MAELEKASGRDLDQWGRLWLETAGVNTLTPELSVDADGAITLVRDPAVGDRGAAHHPPAPPRRRLLQPGRRRQAGAGAPRGAGRRRRAHRGAGSWPGWPRPDLVLLNDDDLAYAKVRLDEASLATATAHLKDFSREPAAHAGAGARPGTPPATAKAPARGYVELILANIAYESDSSVILVQLRQLATTLTFYVAEEHREATDRCRGGPALGAGLELPAGSDAQLQFAKSFACWHRSGAAAGHRRRAAGRLTSPWTG